jgi:hypothetical protein
MARSEWIRAFKVQIRSRARSGRPSSFGMMSRVRHSPGALIEGSPDWPTT